MVGASRQALRFGGGIASALLFAGIAFAIWGGVAAVAAFSTGMLATGLQLLAAWRMGRTGRPIGPDQMQVYVIGVALRFVGVVILGVVATMKPEHFPPLPSAMGYLGTVLPLLYLETRLTR